MATSSRQALVADIGGTHARFAIADIDELTISHFVSLECRMFSSLRAAIEAYMASIPYRPGMAAFALAAPVDVDEVKMTNLDWSFNRGELSKASGADKVVLVNDFEALALVLPYLVPHDLHRIGGDDAVDKGPRVVLGPGTGLGVAGLVHAESGWRAVPSEGGHIGFAAEDSEEFAIMQGLRQGKERVSAERLISGPGLEKLYAHLVMAEGSKRARPVRDVVKLALTGADPVAEKALDYFCRWLGRFAGDIALVYGARGGVYLAGGIAPVILKALEAGSFLAAFQAKGRLSGFLESIPIHVITAKDAGLRGAALAL